MTRTMLLSICIHVVIIASSSIHLAAIVDHSDPVIDFNGNPSNVNEDAGIAVVSLISSGAVSQEVTVDLVVQTGAGEASPGFDYSGTGTYTATFANGDSAASIDLTIIDDTLSEADEIVTISINTVSTGADAGTTTPIASFTILQDLSDTELVQVNFRSAVYDLNEMFAAIPIEIDFVDSNGQPTAINEAFELSATVPNSGTSDTATLGSDYSDPTSVAVTLPIDATSTSLTFTVTILPDVEVESTEVFYMSMAASISLSFTSLGSLRSETEIRIHDDDLESMMCIVPTPEVSRTKARDFEFYAFTSLTADAASIRWSKNNLPRRFGTLGNVGSNGMKLSVSRPSKNKGRRFGYYTFTSTGTSGASLSCNTFIRASNKMFGYASTPAQKYTRVIYPATDGGTALSSAVALSIQYNPPSRRKKLIWTKDGVLLNGRSGPTITLNTVRNAGVYVVSRFVRRRTHFTIIEVIASDCPENQYRSGSCTECPTCYNGGVCNPADGRCICPPCFEGVNCELIVTDIAGFGHSTRFNCISDLGASGSCRGVLFTFEGIYGTSCGCGWSGSNCLKACSRGTFGADCSQTCHCANPSACNGMTGECTDGGGCEEFYEGANCQVSNHYYE
ncbi:uncharacterized protein [Apostichopus japonicus]|uniref:uncharacterized protein isoform X2 n=1 Tax=Stichopus japonicus TaxID=307972 RepID=UPI003AB406C5